MLRGIYTSTAGMASEMSAMEVLTNDMANSQTTGYKEDFASLVRQDANPLSYGMGGLVRSTGTLQAQTALNLAQGALLPTGNPLDLALQGPALFGVQSGGQTTYTRDGRFNRAAGGQLVTASGAFVLGANGAPITLPDPQGQPITVRSNGTIQIGATVVGQIGMFNASGWQKIGNGNLQPTGAVTTATNTIVQQGMLEQSNIDLSQTMGVILGIERAYEASGTVHKTLDQIAQSAANDVGRLP